MPSTYYLVLKFQAHDDSTAWDYAENVEQQLGFVESQLYQFNGFHVEGSLVQPDKNSE